MSAAPYLELSPASGGETLAVRHQPGAAGGPAILYLHGFGSSQDGEKAADFRRRAATAGVTFCSFDFRGHGRSGGALGELTMSRNLEDVACAAGHLRRQGYRRLVLMGSSMGGAAGLWYAALNPGEIAAAVHLAPAVGLGGTLEAWAGAEGLARWQRDGSIPFANDLVSTELGWGLVEDLRRYPVERLAELTRTPTLLLQGQRDDRVDWRRVAEYAAGCAAGVELHLFAGGDHRLLAYKQRLWELTLGFLGGHGLTPSPAAQPASK